MKKKRIKKIKSWFNSKMTNIKLPKLLVEVDNELHFTDPINSFSQDSVNPIKDIFNVLGTLMDHGAI